MKRVGRGLDPIQAMLDSLDISTKLHQGSAVPIKSTFLVMQQPEAPLELAIASYRALQHIHPEDRSSMRTIAEDFGVHPSTRIPKAMRTAKPLQMTRNTANWTTYAACPPWPSTATLHGVRSG